MEDNIVALRSAPAEPAGNCLTRMAVNGVGCVFERGPRFRYIELPFPGAQAFVLRGNVELFTGTKGVGL